MRLKCQLSKVFTEGISSEWSIWMSEKHTTVECMKKPTKTNPDHKRDNGTRLIFIALVKSYQPKLKQTINIILLVKDLGIDFQDLRDHLITSIKCLC